MKRLLLFLSVPAVVVALVVGLLAAFAPTGNTTYSCGWWPPQLQHEYMALGNSLGWGYGASDPATKGYVPLFHDYLESREPLHIPLLLNNLSIPGATSASLITDELPAALAELKARNGDWWWWPFNDVKVVTVDIGGNDLLALLLGVCAVDPTSRACADDISSTLATFSANFDYILGELRAAAGPRTTIIVMTYYNSLVGNGCPMSGLASLGEMVLEGNPALGLPVGANDLIRSIAAAHNAEVAELVPGGVFPALLGPSNILPDCVHANDSGYQIIADAFEQAFEDQ
jgi:lysophospholipase L1-like esterase